LEQFYCIWRKRKRRKGKKEKSNGFVRVRKEGEKTTMTTKIFSSYKKFPEEYESYHYNSGR